MEHPEALRAREHAWRGEGGREGEGGRKEGRDGERKNTPEIGNTFEALLSPGAREAGDRLSSDPP